MRLCSISIVLLTQASLILSVPVRTKKASKAAPSLEGGQTSASTLHPQLKPMGTSVRHRMYRKTRFDTDGRELTRDEWEAKLQNDPNLEMKLRQDVKESSKKATIRYALREMIKKNPDNPNIVKMAEKEGFTKEDLAQGGLNKSPEAFRKRTKIRAALGRIRKDISRVGTEDEKKARYVPGEYSNQFVKAGAKFPPAPTEGGREFTREDQLLHELGLFRSVLRADPYDPHLVAMRDSLEGRLKTTMGLFYPIHLPVPPHNMPQAPSSSRPRAPSPKSTPDSHHPPAPSLPSSDQPQHKAPPPTLEELRALPAEEKSRYIESLFK